MYPFVPELVFRSSYHEDDVPTGEEKPLPDPEEDPADYPADRGDDRDDEEPSDVMTMMMLICKGGGWSIKSLRPCSWCLFSDHTHTLLITYKLAMDVHPTQAPKGGPFLSEEVAEK
ncbi:hypothetical protein Tco_1040974 [Tanacetum coccineum]|uniref:Uncharacterized protein n=1 Tax=Tanacetum coccineum TaxID=301880 RepID=A0ABQ5GFQ8_9ASTR